MKGAVDCMSIQYNEPLHFDKELRIEVSTGSDAEWSSRRERGDRKQLARIREGARMADLDGFRHASQASPMATDKPITTLNVSCPSP